MNSQGKTSKSRLDLLLVERGFADSRERAKRIIMAGDVSVDGHIEDKPGKSVPVDAAIEVRAALPYVSRGGNKLAAALAAFSIDPRNLVALDVGASTGGFTDCLLQHGAARVYAVDVGYGQLAWKLRTDPRVVVMDRTNIRHLEQLPEGALADLAVIDASFISLALVLPATLGLLSPNGQVIALIKPQFEAGRDSVGKGGVVRDVAVHQRVLEETVARADSFGLYLADLIASPVLGPAGNVEFLAWFHRTPSSTGLDIGAAIARALQEAQALRRNA